MKRLALVTDAWYPQVNGVVRTLETTINELAKLDVETVAVTPQNYKTVPMPTYSEIRLAVTLPSRVGAEMEAARPDFVHIATEGPLGFMARSWCLNNGMSYTTSYHTRFPEYVAARLPVPLGLSYRFVRRLHNSGVGCMVSNTTLERELRARGFRRIYQWLRGVDAESFNPDVPPALRDLPRPIFMYVGRVSVEKNIEAFLDLDLPGTKVVVGDGPATTQLKEKYKDVLFTGNKHGEELTAHYTSADVFVFPSLTDTWGLVLMEALACGVPVAAYPIMGPRDVLGDSGVGVLDWDLRKAALAALDVPRDACRAHALKYSWAESAKQFLDNVVHANEVHHGRMPAEAEAA
jgi:glycosyltransferase involved in cell wall biosynthesis